MRERTALDEFISDFRARRGLPDPSIPKAETFGAEYVEEEHPRDEHGLWIEKGSEARGSGHTDSPEFKKWFGDSVIVNPDGSPRIVYHASPANFDEFQPNSHFGDRQAANQRAAVVGDFKEEIGAPPVPYSVYPVYLKLENPLRMPDLVTVDEQSGRPLEEALADFNEKPADVRARMEESGEEPRASSWEGEESVSSWLLFNGIIDIDEFEDHRSAEDAFELLREKGYDGIVYKNAFEHAGHDSWIVFDPANVKSALAAHEFDPHSKSIKHSAGEWTQEDEAKHPRDEAGRWTESGGEGALGPTREEMAEDLLKSLKGGGFTYDVVHEMSPTSGFVVATHPEAARVINAKTIQAWEIANFMRDNAALLSQPHAHVGGWLRDDGFAVLDVTSVLPDKETALEWGRRYKQEAIFDLSTFTEIPVPGAKRHEFTASEEALHSLRLPEGSDGGGDRRGPPQAGGEARQGTEEGLNRELFEYVEEEHPRGEGGRWVPKDEGDIRRTETREFKKWFGDSKVVDASGDPLVVYHGTTHEFEQFDLKNSTSESYLGKGFYFTSGDEDVSLNYAGVGPDLTQRIEREAERILQEAQDADPGLKYGSPEYKAALAEAEAKAKAELELQHEGAVIPAYLKMENPLILDPDGPSDAFRIDFDEKTGEESGPGIAFVNAIDKVASRYDGQIDGKKLWAEIGGKVAEGATAYEIDKALHESSHLMDVYNDKGELANGDVIRDIYREMGYDGVIMGAWEHFGPKNARGGMKGVYTDTKHYIVWDHRQIRSALAHKTMAAEKFYSEDQPRDERGRWTETGASEGRPGIREERDSEAIDRVGKRMQQDARDFAAAHGFDPEKLDFPMKQGPTSNVGGVNFTIAAQFFPGTGRISIYANGLGEKELLAHEIQHAKFEAVLGAGVIPDVGKPETYAELKETDGFNDYTRAWWRELDDARMSGGDVQFAALTAIDETLADIAREQSKGSWLPVAKPWKDLFEKVNRAYEKRGRWLASKGKRP